MKVPSQCLVITQPGWPRFDPENYYVRQRARLRWSFCNRTSDANRGEMRAAGRLPPGQSLTLKSVPVVGRFVQDGISCSAW
jgi:hypothetical protein